MTWSKKVLNLVFEIFGHGGGKIKRKSISLVIMLLALALTLTANISFAATNTTTNISDQNTGQIDQTNGQNLDKNTVKSSEQQKTQQTATKTTEQTKNIAAGSPSNSSNHAAGSASATTTITTTSVKFTSTQINNAAYSVKAFIEKYNRLPNYVTIGTTRVSMSQFLELITENVININSGSTTKLVTLDTTLQASSGTETVKTGSISKSAYVSIAKTINSYMNKYGKAPSLVSTSLGKINFQNMVYSFSKILTFQKTNKRLPNYVSVSKWSSSSSSEGSGSTSNSSLAKYLVATANAQSTSSTIKNLAASITAGKTTTYAKAQAIFNWVRDHLSYSYYYNSKKGALGALSSRTANCCDTSHLVVALARAASIPARYQHGTCKFSDGWYGHVWAQLYVNGKWYYADAISNYNSFGSIKNWNLSSYTLHGTYASLPF